MARRVAVVFGGTGFIGRYVVQRLAKRDYVVRVVTRGAEAARSLMTQGMVGQIVPVAAGTMDAPALHRALEGAEIAVNLIGILSEGHAGDFARVHAALPGRIATAAAAAGVTHLVQISAIGADPASESLYARSKAEGEAAVLSAFPRATILRPSVVFGHEDAFFNRFAGLARVLPVLPLVGGSTRFQPVYVGDVADAVMAAIERPEAAGRTFELAGPRAATFRALMEYMLQLIGRRRPVVEMPAGLARLQARLTAWLPNPPLTQDQIILLRKDNVPSGNLPGLAELGIAPTSLEAILPSYLTRFREGGGRRAVIPG